NALARSVSRLTAATRRLFAYEAIAGATSVSAARPRPMMPHPSVIEALLASWIDTERLGQIEDLPGTCCLRLIDHPAAIPGRAATGCRGARERLEESSVVLAFGCGRRVDLIDDLDVRGMDDRSALVAESLRQGGVRPQAVEVRDVDEDTVERVVDAGGSGVEDDLRPGVQELGSFQRPVRTEIGLEIAVLAARKADRSYSWR